MKKRAVAICLCIVLAMGGIAVTMAYFTDTEQTVNTFTVGKVGISLDETDVDDSTPNKDRDIANKYHLLPGSEYIKDPILHVDIDSEDCYLYVKVENGLVEIIDDPVIESQILANNWTPLNGTTNIYYSEYKAPEIEPAQPTDFVVFKSFRVKGGDVTNSVLAEHENEEIKVTAYAIQKAGFKNAEEAWNTAKHQFDE